MISDEGKECRKIKQKTRWNVWRYFICVLTYCLSVSGDRWSKHRDQVEAVRAQAGTALLHVPRSALSIQCQDSLLLHGPAHLLLFEHQHPHDDLLHHQLNLLRPQGSLQAPHRGGTVLAPSTNRKGESLRLKAVVGTHLHQKFMGGTQIHLISLWRRHQIYVPLYLNDQHPGPVVCLLDLVSGPTQIQDIGGSQCRRRLLEASVHPIAMTGIVLVHIALQMMIWIL
jgi:hypothetical protein